MKIKNKTLSYFLLFLCSASPISTVNASEPVIGIIAGTVLSVLYGGICFYQRYDKTKQEENKRFYTMEKEARNAPTTTPEDVEKYKAHELYYADFKNKDQVIQCVKQKKNQDIHDLLACIETQRSNNYIYKK